MADHRGSITQDSNPEGINQYTGGSSSKEAHDLTAQANRVGTADVHREAAKAHFAAAQQQHRNANSVAAASHLEAAKYHTDNAKKAK